MDKKLTLSLNEDVIKEAKIYAKSNKISLSRLIESYLDSLSKTTKTEEQITPLVKSISGVISLDSDFNTKEYYAEYLSEKYK